MGGKGKGGAKAAYLPPAQSRRPADDPNAGPTITEKIKARKAAGGAEAWDDYKARIYKQQQEQHAIDNHDLVMAAAHREALDREREARLKREPAGRPAAEKKKRKERSSDESSDASDDDRRERKHHKHHKKHKKEKHKKHHSSKEHKHHKHKKRKHHSDDSDDERGETKKASEPVALSNFFNASDSD